jgi:phosphohistidine phosphatase
MNLVLIRHAIAEDRAAFARTGRPDARRPLTGEGRRKFRRARRGLRRAAPEISLIATSPYARARETADLLQKVYPEVKIQTVDALKHRGSMRRLNAWLARRPADDSVAMVGHEPDLSRWVAVLTGARRPPLQFKKGGAALISFDGKAAAGKGTLEWLLTPAQLKRLS